MSIKKVNPRPLSKESVCKAVCIGTDGWLKSIAELLDGVRYVTMPTMDEVLIDITNIIVTFPKGRRKETKKVTREFALAGDWVVVLDGHVEIMSGKFFDRWMEVQIEPRSNQD